MKRDYTSQGPNTQQPYYPAMHNHQPCMHKKQLNNKINALLAYKGLKPTSSQHHSTHSTTWVTIAPCHDSPH